MSEKSIYRTIELSDKTEFDKKISVMLNQGWKLVNSNHIDNKYSQSLLYSYDDEHEYVEFTFSDDNDFIYKKRIRTDDRLETVEYFGDGSVRFISGYNENDNKHGEWTEYKRNGRLLTKLTYSDGELLYFNLQKNEDHHGSLFGVGDNFDLSNSQTEKWINPDNDSEQIRYINDRSDSFHDVFGEVIFYQDTDKTFTGNLCFVPQLGYSNVGSFGMDKFDPDNLNKIFRQLFLMKKTSTYLENESSLFFFEKPSNSYFEKDLFDKYIDEFSERRIRTPQPIVHFLLNGNELIITSFGNLDILSESRFHIRIDSEDCIKIKPVNVNFYQSNNPIIEYRYTQYESFTFNKFIWEHPSDYNQNYPSSFFDIGGELGFFNDGKRILSINNLLNVNLRNSYDNYFSEDKRVDWTIHTEDSVYKQGELHILCLSTDKEEMRSIERRNSFKSSNNNTDRSSNSKIIFKDKDNKVVHEEEYGRSGQGCPRDYNEDGVYTQNMGTNTRPTYLIEVMYDKMFGWDSMNEKGLFGQIFNWILHPRRYSHSLWEFYHTVTGDGWIDENTEKSFDEFKFDMEVFLKKEKEDLEYQYIEDS